MKRIKLINNQFSPPLSASSGQVVQVSSPSLSGVKIERPLPPTKTYSVGPASSITIPGRRSDPLGAKIVSPTTSPTAQNNVKVVRVINSASGTSPSKGVQFQKSQPRILNQTWHSEVKSEPSSSRNVTVVRKSDGEPPSKKTKYITLTSSQINQIEGATILGGGGKSKRIVMLPSNYREQLDKISPTSHAVSSGQTFKIVQEFKDADPSDETLMMGMKKSKRPCNCTKSQCLKFYCDCFAAGEYCYGCNCKDCMNDKDSEERDKAVKLCMERNPFAFRAKEAAEEQQRLHQRGCNCKRSGCLKNYCECYEAKISCSANCRCLGRCSFSFFYKIGFR